MNQETEIKINTPFVMTKTFVAEEIFKQGVYESCVVPTLYCA